MQDKRDEMTKKISWTMAINYILLICLQEIGDKSMFSAIAISAKYSFMSVILGGFLAHTLCTVLAIICGKLAMLAFSKKFISIVGGVLFIVFGLLELWDGVIMNDQHEGMATIPEMPVDVYQ